MPSRKSPLVAGEPLDADDVFLHERLCTREGAAMMTKHPLAWAALERAGAVTIEPPKGRGCYARVWSHVDHEHVLAHSLETGFAKLEDGHAKRVTERVREGHEQGRMNIGTLQDLLGLVMEEPPTIAELLKRTPQELAAAEEWASREHLAASDNPVRRRRRPAWLSKP